MTSSASFEEEVMINKAKERWRSPSGILFTSERIKINNIDNISGYDSWISGSLSPSLQKENVTNGLVLEALSQIIEFRREHKFQYESLFTANQEIIKQQSEILQLQNELREKTEGINALLLTRKNANRIYYAGVATGIISGIGGAIFNNFLYVFVGVGICITALTGLWEAKRNVC